LLSLPTELLTLIGDYLLETPDNGDNATFPPTARKRASGHSDLGSLICTNRRFCAVFTPLLDRLASTQREYGVVAFHWSVAIGNIRLVRLLMENALDISKSSTASQMSPTTTKLLPRCSTPGQESTYARDHKASRRWASTTGWFGRVLAETASARSAG
jgi:hypothetical protein